MTLHNRFKQAKDVIEPGEELLYKEYDYTQVPGKKVTILLAVDGGSTQTRSILLDTEKLGHYVKYLQDIFTIPSMSVSVNGDHDIVPVTKRLYDTMDSVIVNTSGSSDALLTRERVVRGSKVLAVENSENRIGSSTLKTEDPTFYLNLLDNAGNAIIRSYSGALPEKVEIYLSIALPPEDTHELSVARLRHNLSRYKWMHKDSGLSFEFAFTKFVVMTEPEAEVKAYYTLQQEEEPEYTLHFNGGGRSIGVEILMNGKSVKNAQKTLDFGGTQLLDLIGGNYVRSGQGRRTPRRDRLEEAVRTGMLKDGNSYIDIRDIIVEAKKEFGRRIFLDSRSKVFDLQSRVVPTDLNVISVSGRLFDKGEYGFSVAETLLSMYNDLTPSTETAHFTESYIPQGLLLEGITQFFTEDEIFSAVEKAAAEDEALAQEQAAIAAEEELKVPVDGEE